jgi:hypothetical protein
MGYWAGYDPRDPKTAPPAHLRYRLFIIEGVVPAGVLGVSVAG